MKTQPKSVLWDKYFVKLKTKKGVLVMAFFDWNHDGKKDVQDDFIEYNIYKESTGHSENNGAGDASGCLTFILIALASCFIMSLFLCG